MITEWDIRVRSTDIDGDGIVNNARYFEFFEQARLEHMTRLELIRPLRPEVAERRHFTIAETTCRYKMPLRYRDWIRVRCWFSEVRNRSFVLTYEILMRDSSTLVAEGTSVQVWLNSEGRPDRLPEDLHPRLLAAVQ
ncbi:MAG: acyl-CoA thioesterase [Pseudomonadales bacterium]|nr:acyl-CoA thioesterase [Pseudomonadales bacterium]